MENKSIPVTGEAGHKGNRRGAPSLHLALTLSYMAGIYWLSSIPGNIDPEDAAIYGIIAWTPPALQNLLHIPLFGILAWLWYRTLRCWFASPRVLLSSSFLLAAGYGAIDECHQLQVPGRYASLTDIALNTLGVLLVLCLLTWKRSHVR
jgi:glycopeptide antibiotics resistance protein